MKRLVAISLVLLYSGFLTGTVLSEFSFSIAAEKITGYDVSVDNTAGESSTNSELKAVKLAAYHKHIAATVKSKISRVNTSSVELRTNFPFSQARHFQLASAINTSPHLYVPVIIKNCVFRI